MANEIRTTEAPISKEEMFEMFGETMPPEAVELLFSAPDTMTVGKIRAALRELADDRR